MAKPHDIKIGFELRPCIVGGYKALWHGWVQGKVRIYSRALDGTFALIEYESGVVRYARPEDVCFLDSRNKFSEYDFGECESGGKQDA